MVNPPSNLLKPFFSGPDAPDEAELYKCIHCGFCLQACPTYLETGLETESPRGRIALMKAVNEGRITATPNVVKHWDLCIQCRSCETACPSGVPYGRLIESVLSQVAPTRKTGLLPRVAAEIPLKRILPNQRRLSFVVDAIRLYQRSGLQRLVRKTGALRLASPGLAELERSMPSLPSSVFKAEGQVIPSSGKARMRVALLSGCVMPLINGPQMDAVVRVLARNGCEVLVPKSQVCCGAINTHVGDLKTARALARRNIDVFLSSGVDVVVVASAGCGSRMKEYGHLLKDTEYEDRARQLSGMVKDVHEFLVSLPFEAPQASLSYRVTYQDSCHLSHGQRITRQPRDLLRSIPGVEFVDMPNASMCCGAGGTYTLTEREFSLRVLDSKMVALKDTSADVVATANPGCMLQLQYGVAREKLSVEVRYVTDLLDEAYQLG